MAKMCHQIKAIPFATLVTLHNVVITMQAVAAAKAKREGIELLESIEQDFKDYMECVRVFLPLWDKILVKENDTKLLDQYADEIVKHAIDSFDVEKDRIRKRVVDGDKTVDISPEWKPVMDALLQASGKE
jgi:hypothetical protein